VRVLFLSPDFIFPADRGLRVRSMSQLRVLSALESTEQITVLSLSETEVDQVRIRALEREVPKARVEPAVMQPTHMRRSPKHMPRLIRLRAMGMPYLVAKYDSASMHALVAQHLQTGAYDVVYLGQLGMAGYLRSVRRLAPRARVVLEEHNVEWEIFHRLAPSFGFPLREAVLWEARTLRIYETRVLREIDSTIAISDADALALQRLSGTTPTVVPTYIERSAKRVEAVTVPSLAYTGTLGWQPNAQGLDWFCRDVWPRIRQRIPEATLTIAGPGLNRNADGSLAVPPNWCVPGVTTVGYVDDLEEVYRRSLAMIAPVVGGSGVRMKLLESMKAGVPTVTTSDGAAGLAVEDGREMFVADTPDQFAESAVRLLSDPQKRDRVRTAGYAYLEAHHSLAEASKKLRGALAPR
jgi:glycosyltransferase involved in cell wall biosynthesis